MMDVCAKRHLPGAGPFAGVSLLLVAKLGCSACIAAMWEVSWGSAEPPLSRQEAGYTRYLLDCPRAVLQCVRAWPHCQSTCGWKRAGGTIALLQRVEEVGPLCPKERAQPAGTPARHRAV